MNEEIKKFTLDFFKGLGANINNEREIFTIKEVSKSFEDFYGKKSPYNLVFDASLSTKDRELVDRGSFLLNSMKEYLESRGETTILKIELETDPKSEFLKRFFLKNLDIASSIRHIKNNNIIRFSFITTLQYLNQQEQIVSHIFVDKDRIVDFNIDNYKISEGKKEDIHLGKIKEQYDLAKVKVREIIAPKIEEKGQILEVKLNKEIERIKQHYKSHNKEYQDSLDKNNRQIKELETQATRAGIKESDKNMLKLRIDNLKQAREELLKNSQSEKLRKEEEFHIKDETFKHSLNISSKLMNTSIIYYPLFTYSLLLKNSEASKNIEIEHNILENTMTKLNCESCGKEINKINLCSTGHLSCDSCFRGCGECGKDYCNICLSKSCFLCGKRLCRKCALRCSSCGKYKCLSHMSSSSRSLCETCSRSKPVGRFGLFPRV